MIDFGSSEKTDCDSCPFDSMNLCGMCDKPINSTKWGEVIRRNYGNNPLPKVPVSAGVLQGGGAMPQGLPELPDISSDALGVSSSAPRDSPEV